MNETTKLPTATHMGRVALSVADLARSVAYYERSIGLQVRARTGQTAVLGTAERDLLLLREQPGAQQARGTTGLYHFALLLPSRRELARTLRHLSESETPLGGFADHAVSEAIYLSDPDGHGIEIYRDRPRDAWEYPAGTLKMTVDPFDFDGVLGELHDGAPAWSGIAPGTVMGHVHLHVAHIAAAEHFYGDVLGFDLMVRYGRSASFMAAGGYHHHLGLNTWAGVGAPPPPPGSAHLLWYEIALPAAADLHAVQQRLAAHDVPWQQDEAGIRVRDPAHNEILLTQRDG